MKKLVLIIILLIPILSFAQKIKEYKATNGVTYHVKDTIMLGTGSDADSSFAYIQQGGTGIGGVHHLPAFYLHTGVAIKSIKKSNGKYEFMIDGDGGVFRYTMDVDAAIAACEVTPCTITNPAGQRGLITTKQPVGSVADEIKKLKELLDSGALTQAEFDAQKKKLLNQ